jgi:hypothetical protein
MLACSLVATPAMPPVRARGFCPSISSLRFIVHELGARVRSFLRHMEQKAGSTFSASRTSRSCVSAFSRLVTDHTPTDARCPTCGAATASGPFGLAASAAHFFSTFPGFSQCQAAVDRLRPETTMVLRHTAGTTILAKHSTVRCTLPV